MKYGYVRVSTDGQSADAQVRQLKAGFKKVFRETASGAKADRRQLRRALDQLAACDVLRVNRPARNAVAPGKTANAAALAASVWLGQPRAS